MNDRDITNFETSSAQAIAEIRTGFIEMNVKLDALKVAERETERIVNHIYEGEATAPILTVEDTDYLERCRALDDFFCKTKGCARMASASGLEYCERCLLA